jgi:hypothetical protein
LLPVRGAPPSKKWKRFSIHIRPRPETLAAEQIISVWAAT